MLEEGNQTGASPKNSGEVLAEHFTEEEKENEVEEVQLEDQDESRAEDVGENIDNDEDTEEVEPFESAAELAEAAGFENEDEFLKSIKVKGIVNGEEVEMSVHDAIQGYQRTEDYTRKSMALAEERKSFEVQRQQISQYFQNQREVAVQLLNGIRQQYMQEFESVDWSSLDDDPARKTQLKFEMKEKQEQLAAYEQQVLGQAEKQRQIEAEELKKKQSEHLHKESEILRQKAPDFSQEDQKAIWSDLSDRGFNQDEIQAISNLEGGIDHRHILLLRDAAKGREIPKKEVLAKKKLKSAKRRLLKPGAQKSKQDIAEQQKRDQQGRFKKTGDAGSLLADHFRKKYD